MRSALQTFLLVILLIIPAIVNAGPPYDTDDPEPVDFEHWELYFSSIGTINTSVISGTAPHVEVNYGALPNLQIHVIAPLSFYSAKPDKTNYGYGDTEFGIKYRFINKDSGKLQVGIFPLIEFPTGNTEEHLGNGKPQIYVPLWIQKKIRKWTTYGGGGYWINPGTGNKNYEFIGWQQQYQFSKSVNIGTEIYYITASQAGGSSDLRFRIGSVIDFSDNHHLLLSVGRSIIGDTNLLWYVGYQFTI